MARWYKELMHRMLINNTDEMEIIEHEISEFMKSDELEMMKKAESYYRNRTDIQNKRVDADWKNNAKIELGLFRKLVKQKVGYLLMKEPTIGSEDETTREFLSNKIFTKETLKVISALGTEAIKKGIAYSLVYYDEEGQLCLFKVPTEQIIPLLS